MIKRILFFSIAVSFVSLMLVSSNVSAMPNPLAQCLHSIKTQSYKTAVQYGNTAVKAMPKDINARLCLGIAEDRLGSYKDAFTQFESAIPLAKDKTSLMLVYSLSGETIQHMGDYDKAFTYDSKSLQLAVELKNKNFEGAEYNNIAEIYKNKGKLKKSLEYFKKSLDFSVNKISTAKTYGNIALLFEKTGDYTKALAYQEKSLKINRAVNYNYGIAEDLLNIGGTYLNLHNFAIARKYITKGLAMEKELGNKQWIGSGYGYLADLYFRKGNYDKSIYYYKKSYKMYKASGDISGEKVCLSMIYKINHPANPEIKACASYVNKKMYTASLSHCRKATVASPRDFYPWFLYGKAYMGLKNYHKAIVKFKTAAAFAKDPVSLQLVYNWLGGTFLHMGNYKDSLLFLKKSLDLSQKMKNIPDELSNIYLIKTIYFKEKNFKKDIYYSKKYLSFLNNKKAIALEYDKIGVMYYNLNDRSDSIKYNKKSLDINLSINNYSGASLDLINIGHSYIDLEKFGKAKKYLSEGITMADRAGDKYKKALGYVSFGYLYQIINKKKEAITYYGDAYNIFKGLNLKNKPIAEYCMFMIQKLKKSSS